MEELSKHYDPKTIEAKWYDRWVADGLFHGEAGRGGEPYCIVIPPPNVTGILHMGHALNNTIQDMLIRWQRMQGKNVVWVPGTDHAGIATQNVVERQLKKEGKTRDDLGREAFLDRVWDWKEQYGNTIINQLKKLGASCDWDRERFTMDEGLSHAVLEVFVRMYEKGLIYRGHYIINWCPRCQTALSDEESEHQDTNGKLYYIRYPVKGSGTGAPRHVIVATTRPETMLGDVAVAVNPRDSRYSFLSEDSVLILPILNRELKIIRDGYVDPEFGTGAVKVTPAHDPNDFEMGQRHTLEPINVMHDDGIMNEHAGPYKGLDRFECRKRLVDDLTAADLVEKIEDHAHAVGHCYRCDTVVEPRLSRQWFVKMQPLAEPAIEVVKKGQIKFMPERWTKVYLEWMENIRDWCISRQIWWGHRIPVYYCDACEHEWAASRKFHACPSCRSEQIRQDEDVLDTWFSSWLWPFSVFNWPNEDDADLHFYYPTETLVTASEIIFFWVARMIMAGLEFRGEIPFSKVYIHGTVRDDIGRKMSKSLGNSIDPLDIIEKYSADALRFSLMMITATGQDVFLSDEKFEIGRNFGTKIWNAARFMLMHSNGEVDLEIDNPELDKGLLSTDDKHIIAKLHEAISGCNEHLERFRFNDVAKVLYEFLWHQYCDWYVEYAKDPLYGDHVERKQNVLKVMHYVFSGALRLLHPIMPFITEELWHGMGYNALCKNIVIAPWPKYMDYDELKCWGIDEAEVGFVDAKYDMIRAARTLMSDFGLLPKHNVDFVIKPANERHAEMLESDVESIAKLLKAGSCRLDKAFSPAKVMPSALSKLGTIYMSIDGVIKVDEEIARLSGQLDKINQDLTRVNKKLGNMDFLNKAPADVVAREEKKKKELFEKNEKLRKLIDTLAQHQ